MTSNEAMKKVTLFYLIAAEKHYGSSEDWTPMQWTSAALWANECKRQGRRLDWDEIDGEDGYSLEMIGDYFEDEPKVPDELAGESGKDVSPVDEPPSDSANGASLPGLDLTSSTV
jgi:hypothetical protein